MSTPLLPPKPFLMIRHGESTANADGSVAGIVDVALTPKGRAQADAARACFEKLPDSLRPCQIVHSHLIRAKDTASIINQNTGLPLFEEPALCERDFGDWAYQSWAVYGPKLAAGETPPGGESVDAFADRALAGLARQLARFETLTLFSCHGGVFSALAYRWNCLDSELADVGNCALYGFFPAPGDALSWRVTRYGLDDRQGFSETVLTLNLSQVA